MTATGALVLFGLGTLASLFPFHSWAAPGYSAAPTPVSMLHAGALKKFGLYGIILLGLSSLDITGGTLGTWFLWFALANVVLVGLICGVPVRFVSPSRAMPRRSCRC